MIELTSPFLDPRRDHNRRHTNSKPIELEERRRRAGVPIGARHIDIRSLDMVKEPAMFVISDNQKCLIPLRTSPQRLIHLLNQLLPVSNIMRRVIVVRGQSLEIEIPRFDHRQARELPIPSIFLKLQIELMKLEYVFQLPKIPIKKGCGYVLKVNPKVQIILMNRIENRLLWVPLSQQLLDMAC